MCPPLSASLGMIQTHSLFFLHGFSSRPLHSDVVGTLLIAGGAAPFFGAAAGALSAGAISAAGCWASGTVEHASKTSTLAVAAHAANPVTSAIFGTTQPLPSARRLKSPDFAPSTTSAPTTARKTAPARLARVRRRRRSVTVSSSCQRKVSMALKISTGFGRARSPRVHNVPR